MDGIDLSERWPPAVRIELETFGWYEGRSVEIEGWRSRMAKQGGFVMHPAAERFLREFGGLTVHIGGPGHTRARSGFDFDPVWASFEDDRFQSFASYFDGPVFPVGEAEDSHGFIALSEHGTVYELLDWIGLVGRTPDEAIINLIEGVTMVRIRANAPSPYRAGELCHAVAFRLDSATSPNRREWGADWLTVRYDDGTQQEVPVSYCAHEPESK